MKVKNFKYTKKKDGQTKVYLVLVLDEDEKHIGGIDLGKLEKDEFESCLKTRTEFEVLENEIMVDALSEHKSFEEYVENDRRKSAILEYEEKMQPYIKKAYRKFLTDNIEEYLG